MTDMANKRAYDAAYYIAHREQIRACQREWRRKNAAKIKADRAAYSAAHRSEIRAKVRKWNEANPGRARVRTAAWAAANPGRKRDLDHQRRSRATERCTHPACLVLGPVRVAWQSNPHRCYMCGVPVSRGTIQMDHLVPLALGGIHCADNLRPACPPCNQSKGARFITYDSAPPADWPNGPFLMGLPPDDYMVVPGNVWLDWFGRDEA